MKWGRSWRDSTKKAGSWIGKSPNLTQQMVKVAPTRCKPNANEAILNSSLGASCQTGRCVTSVKISCVPRRCCSVSLCDGAVSCSGKLLTGGFWPITVQFASAFVLWTTLWKVTVALSSSLCSSFQYVIIVKIIRSWKVLCILRYVPGFFLKKKVKIKN